MAKPSKPLNLHLKEGALTATAQKRGLSTKNGLSMATLHTLAHSTNPLTRRRAVLAMNMRSWGK